ncbi:translocation/assembly module TamB domain-containing protein [Arcticibacterium luteifluviistationis]|uniref:Translocation and assembly module TamB C-terminal domain-containing protein n=1 Tax=Arcticibacterium luteifluviistationis TaxID=1784714 RepID=A0A2Z4GI44_9BACT|nr:translocation/assembly module TamB domain-containing protein [Arcticibacterium luteifluviistationis]AWW00639.1 hypothetical protein DJ013_21610 [Arcticibacterium luteifluviistationis]
MTRALKVLAWIIGISVSLMLFVFWYVGTESGQKLVTTEVNKFLKSKIDTPFSIGAIRYEIPDFVSVADVYVEDTEQNELLSTKRFRVDISMWALVRGIIDIDQILIEDANVNVYRNAPNEDFNYQFLIDAFASDTTVVENQVEEEPTTGPFFSLNQVKANRLSLAYKDEYGGVNFKGKLDDIRVSFSEIDLNTNKYHINNIDVNDGYAVLKTFNGKKLSTIEEASSALDLDLNGVRVNNVAWKLIGDDLGIDNKIIFKNFELELDELDLNQNLVKIDFVNLLDSKVQVAFRAGSFSSTSTATETEEPSAPWNVSLGELLIDNTNVVYDDENAPRLARGFDYNHLNFKGTKIDLADVSYTESGIEVNLNDVKFRDKSKLTLERLSGKVTYSDTGITLENIDLRTPYSEIKTDTKVTYNSIDDLSENLPAVNIDLKINNSFLAVSDMLLLSPSLDSNQIVASERNQKIKIKAAIKGGVSALQINELKMEGLQNSKVSVSGSVARLDNMDYLKADLNIQEFTVNSGLVNLLVSDAEMLADYNIPDRLSLKGKIKGDAGVLNIDTDVTSTLGDLKLNGVVRNLGDSTLLSYEGNLHTEDLAVDKFFKEKQDLGLLSTDIYLKSDASFQTIEAKGEIQKIVYSGYTYQGLEIDATMVDSLLNLKGSSKDPNARLTTEVTVDLGKEEYPVNGNVSITKLNLAALGLSDFEEDIKGVFDLNMTSLKPDELTGTFKVMELALGTLNVGELSGDFINEKNKHIAKIESPFLKVNLEGEFDYYALPDILAAEVNGYFKQDSVDFQEISGKRDFELTAEVLEHPIWQVFVPELAFDRSIRLNATLNEDKLKGEMNFGNLTYGDILLKDFQLDLTGNGKELKGNAKLKSLRSGSFILAKNEFDLKLSNSILDASFVSKDSLSEDKRHGLALRMETEGSLYKIALNDLTVDKKEYKISKTPIYYGDDGILINGLTISKDNEMLTINATKKQLNANVVDIAINPFANFAGYKSEGVKGKLNGDLVVVDYMEDYNVKGDLAVKGFEVGGIAGGDLTLNIEEVNAVHAAISGGLDGKDSKLDFKGNVGLTGDVPVDFTANITKVDARLIESLSGGQLTKSKGFVTGKIKLSGNADKPLADGKLSFVDYNVTPYYLGIPLKIEDQQVYFKGNDVSFENFVVKDSLNQKMAVNGKVDWSNLDAVSYDLKLDTKNFLLINAERGSNDFFYGKANINANLKVSGVGASPSMNGKIRVNEQSNMTVIMPTEVETAESNGVVTFVPPPSDKEIESLEIPTTKLANGTGLDSEVILDIETDSKAELSIILDELTGDKLSVKGSANLTVGIYPTGEIFCIGIYEITSGSYNTTLVEVLKKNFLIEPGSVIIWSGDPMRASLQLKAVYQVNPDINPLLKEAGILLEDLGKVPLDVILKIDGTIENPLISFEMEVSDKASSTTKTLLESNDVLAFLSKDDNIMNQQVFLLLTLNQFLFTTDDFDLGSVLGSQSARQSVSKLLTEQLNALAGDIIGSVGLNFGLNSEQIGTGGNSAYKTDLNIGLKKSFLNDRVKISVGKNFELENSSGIDQNSAELLDNIEIGYNITADGRYAVKVYRTSQFQTVLEGFVLETGVSFVLQAEYEKVKDLFKKGVKE